MQTDIYVLGVGLSPIIKPHRTRATYLLPPELGFEVDARAMLAFSMEHDESTT